MNCVKVIVLLKRRSIFVLKSHYTSIALCSLILAFLSKNIMKINLCEYSCHFLAEISGTPTNPVTKGVKAIKKSYRNPM
ncbi:hypothetical protein MAR_005830 [Mya arenaria]|uniref:Uncharacterized protein n=1 Tax=Mya arenaria TaxID=6604 RepID=A0ABY7F0M0_MYAAR|nr:hypothetical protein MAR_005830 [Mya arenaria]